MWAYVRFHEQIWSKVSRLCIATFDEVTNHFDHVVAKFNRIHGTGYVSSKIDDEFKRLCFAVIDAREAGGEVGRAVEEFLAGSITQEELMVALERAPQTLRSSLEQTVPRPTAARDNQKEELLNQLLDSRLRRPLQQARQWYQRFATVASAQAD
jgi:hypothetical protein